ncbi:MAG: ATP synthase subunit a [Actinobacteria bacterium ADurb.Bin444]|nr:MAG: ATP synthase subunit a [Actinobacteria bacterium ADurb.Bin444]
MSAEAEANKVAEALHELNVQTIVQIPKLGPFDFSITNAVIYMWISALLVFLFYYIVAKKLKKEPGALQTVGESLLNFSTGHLTGQFGEKGKKYYYIILTIFSYIFTMNIIGLIPKPEILKPYTPTANINVTFGMAFVVFLITQFQGFKRHGLGYIRSWLTPPGVPTALAIPLHFIFFVVHLMGEFFKPLSLAIRLFGNTIAGHLVILVMLGLVLQYQNLLIAIPPLAFVIIMTGFEIFVAFLQAYIFALLSVIYIESAIYAGH